jgi:hypothetical protein
VLLGKAAIRNRATSFAVEAENDRLDRSEAERAVHNMRRSVCHRGQQDPRGSPTLRDHNLACRIGEVQQDHEPLVTIAAPIGEALRIQAESFVATYG